MDGTRVVIDVVHPAHVHVFRHVAAELTSLGGEVRWLSREKDTTVELLDRLGIDHTVVSRAAAARGPVADARELLGRVRAIRRELRALRPQVLLTRNPAGVLAGLGTRTWTLFDTDDGRAVGRHYWLAAPFADVVTSSVHDPESHGRGHRRYPGLKAHAFLHPARFRPDPTVRERLGLSDGPLTVLRLSRHDASHDGGVVGIAEWARMEVLTTLRTQGAVVLSEEGSPTRALLPDGSERPVPPDAFHDLLSTAQVCVTDGQSVAAESAVLGVPCLRLSGFTGRVWYLDLLERAGVVRNFRPGEEAALVDAVRVALAADTTAVKPAPRGSGAGTDPTDPTVGDVSGWLVDLVVDLCAEAARGAKPRSGWPRGPRVGRPRAPTSASAGGR